MNIIRKVLAPSRLTPALKGALIAGVACLALMVPAPSRADHDQDQHLAVTRAAAAAPGSPRQPSSFRR